MTTRRQFLRGAVSAAVAASLPASGDGVELYSATHPTPAILPFTGDTDTGIFSPSSDHLRLVAGGVSEANIEKLCISMARTIHQTKEMVAANVFHRGGSTNEIDSNV